MCGIVGCISRRDEVSPILIAGLKRLEYRGYDSAGIAVLTNGQIETVREVGKLSNLEMALSGVKLDGHLGLGHTRWATHGRPTQVNAHPHRDSSGKIVVVHNGIIENFRSLRQEIEGYGVAVATETDSEVIAHLVAHYYEGDLKLAVTKTLRRLEGAYAIGVVHLDCPDVLIGARKDCPLVVGLGESQNFLASDVAALIDHTKQVIYLEDGQVAELTTDEVRVFDLEGAVVDMEVNEITWDLEQAERGGFDHFMLKEIHEQPTIVSDALLGRLDEEAGEIRISELGLSDEELKHFNRINIIACGTSWHAGHVAKFYLETMARLPVDVDYASELRYRDAVLDDRALVICISQSGETADTIAAMRMAAKQGCKILGICNVIGSTISRESQGLIMTHAGPEIGVASTKAFVAQLIALQLLAIKLGRTRGILNADSVRHHCQLLRQIPHAIESVISEADHIHQVAKKYLKSEDFLFIGRGLNYPIALEGALKLKELSYIHAEGYPAGEMKHGPIALIDENMPLVAICTEGIVYEKVVTNVEEARVRDAKVIIIASEGDKRVYQIADDVIHVPRLDECIAPIVNVVPLQLLAYYVALERGCDVDQPRNLAKSVTVE